MHDEAWRELNGLERIETLPAWDMAQFLAGLEELGILAKIPTDDVCAIEPAERFTLHLEAIVVASFNTENEQLKKYFRDWVLRATILLHEASAPPLTEEDKKYPTTYNNIGELAQVLAEIAGTTPQELFGDKYAPYPTSKNES